MPPSTTKKILAEVRSLIEKKNYDRAIELSESVLQKDATNYHAHVFIGVAAVALQNFQLALDSYRSAIRLRPELPPAYKGVIQTLSKPGSPEDPVLLARCHFGLGSRSSDHAEKSLPEAAASFFSLALDNPDIREEAVSTLQSIRSTAIFAKPSTFHDVLTYRICKILSLNAQSVDNNTDIESTEDGEQYKLLTSSPLSEAIDDLAEALCRNNDMSFYDGTAELVIKKACAKCVRDINFVDNLSILLRLNAYEELLCVAETDHALTYISKEERMIFAFRSKHLRPFQISKTRTTCLLAISVLEATGDSDNAIQHVSSCKKPRPSLSIVRVRTPSAPLFRSCTHAFCAAFVHFIREEYKLAIEACKAGRSIAGNSEHLKRIKLLFSLLMGASLFGDRKYKDAAREFGTVLVSANKIEDHWMIHAANCNLIINAVTCYGRQSRAAAIVMEDAVASDTNSSNDYALVECIWSDALSGDVDIDRMQELASRLIDRIKNDDAANMDSSSWEYDLLSPYFTVSLPQLASIASTRLGQMRLSKEGYTKSVLKAAQKDQMMAAELVKGRAEPFAQLGIVMERLGTIGDKEKMQIRASRCYERALIADPGNPVASRQLVRILTRRAMHLEAFEIARNISDRNPKARWAYNVLGWWRISREQYPEAAVAFHAALRGRPKRSAREEDSLFGTDVGCSASDNDLLVDVDSWRGLGVAYRMQGKLGSACACLDDALGLLDKTPAFYTIHARFDVSEFVSSCRTIIEFEREILSVLSRKSAQARLLARSMLEKDDDSNIINGSNLAAGYYATEALMVSAAEEWVDGAYRRATEMREQASSLFHDWIITQFRKQPFLKCETLFKRLGDMWAEAAGGECSTDLESLVNHGFTERCLNNAAMAYSKAAHLAPWEKTLRVQDVAGILQRQAILLSNPENALVALSLLLANMDVGKDSSSTRRDGSDDSYLAAIVLMTVSKLSSNLSLKAGARKLAHRTRQQTRHNAQKLLLDATIATSVDEISSANIVQNSDEGNVDISEYAEAAIRATRADPTDWRGFLAVAKVREADVRLHPRDLDKLHSCEQAFAEADRLGAGPVAVCGRLRCLTRILEELNNLKENTPFYHSEEKLYQEACYLSSLAKRVAKDIPPICVDIMHAYQDRRIQKIQETCVELASGYCSAALHGDHLQEGEVTNHIWQHVHMYPFFPAARELLSLS